MEKLELCDDEKIHAVQCCNEDRLQVAVGTADNITAVHIYTVNTQTNNTYILNH